jgi:hypothetical protein
MHLEQLWEDGEEKDENVDVSDAAVSEGLSSPAPTFTGKGKGRAI